MNKVLMVVAFCLLSCTPMQGVIVTKHLVDSFYEICMQEDNPDVCLQRMRERQQLEVKTEE